MNITDCFLPGEFEKIKTFILQNGDCQTYRNFDNHNPHLRVAGFDVFLNASVGQRNSNNDPGISDFNQITIRDNDDAITYYSLQIVREGDRENPEVQVSDHFQINNVYLLNYHEEDIDKMRRRLVSYYLPKIKNYMEGSLNTNDDQTLSRAT